MGELYDRLKELEYENILPMHMPGAKRNRELVSMPDPVKLDITEVTGFDNLHNATGVIKKLSERAAMLYGADEALLLVNGSTAGIISAVCGATKPCDNVIVARNVHCSVINALYLEQLNPTYVYPEMLNADAGIYGAVSAEDVEKIFLQEDNIDKNFSAVIITSPTYEGIVSDVGAIAEVAHRNGAVLIVDEAHGAHFGFHEAFPQNAVRQGADAVIMSLHKTLPSFTQTALLTLNLRGINADRVKMYWNMMQSTSPSYILMGSIDSCVSLLEERGRALFDSYVARLQKLISEIRKLKHIRMLETDDISKIVLLVNDGAKFSEKLREIYKIELEMASEKYVIAMTSIGDTDEGYVRFIQALRNLDEPEFDIYGDENCGKAKENILQKNSEDAGNDFKESMYAISRASCPKISISIYDALNSEKEKVQTEESVGRIAGDAVCIYPPGINLVNPGEVITDEVIEILKSGMAHGLQVIGLTDDLKVTCVKD